MKISVIIPVYNEFKTIQRIIEEVQKVKLDKEIIVVDDGSTDGSKELVENLNSENIKKVFHVKNQGKGAAVRSALPFIEGDIVIIQDADLEYHPDEYPQLIGPILKDRADVVFGSRFIGAHRCFLFTHYIGNKIVNLIANALFNTNLSDFMTCYKAFKKDIIKNMTIRSDRFGFEPEITGKVFKKSLRVYEVPISYSGRDYSEGKKIKWTDFFVVVRELFRIKIFQD